MRLGRAPEPGWVLMQRFIVILALAACAPCVSASWDPVSMADANWWVSQPLASPTEPEAKATTGVDPSIVADTWSLSGSFGFRFFDLASDLDVVRLGGTRLSGADMGETSFFDALISLTLHYERRFSIRIGVSQGSTETEIDAGNGRHIKTDFWASMRGPAMYLDAGWLAYVCPERRLAIGANASFTSTYNHSGEVQVYDGLRYDYPDAEFERMNITLEAAGVYRVESNLKEHFDLRFGLGLGFSEYEMRVLNFIGNEDLVLEFEDSLPIVARAGLQYTFTNQAKVSHIFWDLMWLDGLGMQIGCSIGF